MQLDIEVRFYDDVYKTLGRGHASITTENDELPVATLHQLGLAAPAVIAGMIKHAQLEAVTSLKQQAREKEEKEKEAQS
jgi:hypothetical protein